MCNPENPNIHTCGIFQGYFFIVFTIYLTFLHMIIMLECLNTASTSWDLLLWPFLMFVFQYLYFTHYNGTGHFLEFSFHLWLSGLMALWFITPKVSNVLRLCGVCTFDVGLESHFDSTYDTGLGTVNTASIWFPEQSDLLWNKFTLWWKCLD